MYPESTGTYIFVKSLCARSAAMWKHDASSVSSRKVSQQKRLKNTFIYHLTWRLMTAVNHYGLKVGWKHRKPHLMSFSAQIRRKSIRRWPTLRPDYVLGWPKYRLASSCLLSRRYALKYIIDLSAGRSAARTFPSSWFYHAKSLTSDKKLCAIKRGFY